MKVIVIDPGFETDHGHHYPMNEFIFNQTRKGGNKAVVIGPKGYRKSMAEGFSRNPNFLCKFMLNVGSYTLPLSHREAHKDFFLLKIAQFSNFNIQIAADLTEGLPVHLLEDGDVILVHTVFLSSVVGIANWLRKPNLPKVHVRLVFRFPPWFYEVHKSISEIFFQEALSFWEDVPADVALFTDVEEYTHYVKGKTTLPVYTTPIGLEFFDEIPSDKPKGTDDTGYTFVAGGLPHAAKGSDLLPEAMERHLQSFPQDKFIIQGRKKGYFPPFFENKKPKEIFSHPHVQLRKEIFGPKDFHRLLQKADVLLNPYHPIDYNFRTSHIFMEGLGLNRVVIGGDLECTRQWMKEFGNVGLLLKEHSVEALVEAMASVRSNIEEHRAAVEKVYSSVREKNNGKRWLEFVMNPTKENSVAENSV